MTNDEIIGLINRFENAVQKAWIYDTRICYDEYYDPSKLNKSDLLFEECAFLKEQLIFAVTQQDKEQQRLQKQASDASWKLNPDRSGGQFTQVEITESSRGGHGW